jgi:hypothetical protein
LIILLRYPALKRGAKVGRPSGAELRVGSLDSRSAGRGGFLGQDVSDAADLGAYRF